MIEGTISGTIIGGHVDRHSAVFTVLEGGVVSELVITPDMLVLPDEAVLGWESRPVILEPKQV